ncbi:MAG: hypothetical protein U1C74_03460 [Phenylobacterium sp.]|nr:hypothetical protein [Phenylobacterium sp.]
MNEVLLRVHPASGGWWIDCDLPIEPTYYQSGAQAEEAARGLATRLSGAGHNVRLVVNDRSQQLVAQHRYPAP